MRRIALLVAIAGLVSGCGRGDEGANRSIVADLPKLDGVELLDEHYYRFCSRDSCPLGNDRSGALLVYAVDTDVHTQASLVDAYRSALVGWNATVDTTCANADRSFCDEGVLASFTRGEARIDLNLDNWSVGQFELHVDAKGAA